jgi:hypothetical protein
MSNLTDFALESLVLSEGDLAPLTLSLALILTPRTHLSQAFLLTLVKLINGLV